MAGAGIAWGARQILRLSRRISLDDRVVIVTGASSGHGLMVARYAAQHGARLVLAARDTENLYAAEIEMIHAGAREVLAVPTDVTDREQCQYLVNLAAEKFGQVDILINNAGIIQVGPVETMTIRDIEEAHGHQFLGRRLLHDGRDPLHAQAGIRPDRQRDLDRRQGAHAAPGVLSPPASSP